MKVMGIDPGLRITGYAVMEQVARGVKVLDAGVFRADPEQPLELRLKHLYGDIQGLLREYPIEMVAIEELYAHYKHPRTAILMGHARGIFLLAAAVAGVPVKGFAATRIKKSLTGNGRASKEQVQRAVCQQLNLPQLPEPPDVADALAIAMCCLNENGRGELLK